MAAMKSVVAVVGLMFLASQFAIVAEAVTCNPVELSPCLVSFTSPAPPSGLCCTKLREQEPCLCIYIKNPAFAPYINSPQAPIVEKACNVPPPQCG